ncbi:MAG: hypothetical protein AAGA08_19890 [Pseudomonadota bacterium]
MPILITILGLIAAAGYWVWRARNAAEMTHELLDVASDIRAAARRFGFRRNQNRHPVEDIEDPNIAIAGIAVSFLELDDYPTSEERDAMIRGLQSEFGLTMADASELTVLGRWMMTQCNTPDAAVTRMSRKLYKLSKGASFEALMNVLRSMLAEADRPMNSKQKSALEDIQSAFRIS